MNEASYSPLSRKELSHLTDVQVETLWNTFLAQIGAQLLEAHLNAVMSPDDPKFQKAYVSLYEQHCRALKEYNEKWRSETISQP